MGHLRDLPNSSWASTSSTDYAPIHQHQRQGKLIKELKSKAKTRRRLLATDPDREGEAISWHLANILGLDPTSRTV